MIPVARPDIDEAEIEKIIEHCTSQRRAISSVEAIASGLTAGAVKG